MNITTQIFLRTDQKNIDGYCSVNIRFIKNRKVKVIFLNIKVLKKDWNFKNKNVKKTDVSHYRKNKLLRYYKNKAENIIDSYLFSNKMLSLAELCDLFKNKNTNNNDFFSFVIAELNQRKYATATKRTYTANINKIKRFKNSINIDNIDLSFIMDYKNYMLKSLNNTENTMYKSLSILKTFLNWAMQKDIIKENPFKKFKIKKIQGNREYLEIHELNKLEMLLKSDKLNNSQKDILEYFLFDCYTGLRHNDLKALTYSKIKDVLDNENKHKIIEITQHKTKINVSIPLIEKSNRFLKTKYLQSEKIFNVRTSQATNRSLKKIMKIANIEKHITIHCGRHTFATLGVYYGIPIEIVSKMLGHTDIKTTMIYAKIQNNVKFKELSKFDKTISYQE